MSEELRVGVVGLGGMGSTHVEGWRRVGADVHAYDDLPEMRERTAEKANVHGSLADLIAAVDLVDICTPTDTHAAVALAAAKAGRAVVCEKPITRTVEEADELISFCRGANVDLFVAQVVRFFPEYAAAKAAVDSGRIGTPAVLRFAREGGSPAGRRWYHDPKRSGGIISDLMIHDIDYARWVAGPVVRVFAKTARPIGEHASATQAYAVLTHAGGAITHLTASWAKEGVPFRTAFEIAGSEGLLAYSSDNNDVLRTAPPELIRNAGPVLSEPPWTAELREFAAALNGGPPPRVTAEDARAALVVALAALESAESGRAVEVEA